MWRKYLRQWCFKQGYKGKQSFSGSLTWIGKMITIEYKKKSLYLKQSKRDTLQTIQINQNGMLKKC